MEKRKQHQKKKYILITKKKNKTKQNTKNQKKKKKIPHNITSVTFKAGLNLSRLDIPQETFVVTRRGQDLGVGNKATARQETVVRAQFPEDLDGDLLGGQIEDRANVVQTTTGNKVTRGRVADSHHPGRTKGDGVDLVGRDSVPNQQLSVLRGGNNVFVIIRPVQSIDLGQVTLQGPTDLHLALGGAINAPSEVLHYKLEEEGERKKKKGFSYEEGRSNQQSQHERKSNNYPTPTPPETLPHPQKKQPQKQSTTITTTTRSKTNMWCRPWHQYSP